MYRTRKFLFPFFVLLLLCTVCGCKATQVKTFTVTGRVVVSGEGLAGASVSFSGGSVTTDENGDFIIEDLREATVLKAEKEGYAFPSAGVSVSPFKLSCELEGFLCVDLIGLVESNSTPISGAFVKAEGLKGGSVFTDDFGMFVLPGVAGELTVSVEAEGYSFLDKVLEPGETEVVFNGVYSASGKVLAEDGTPISGATVTDGIHTTTTDANGAYVLEGVGAYAEITADLPGYVTLPQTVTVEKENNVADFTAYPSKVYSGTVKSGEVSLSSAEIVAEFTPDGYDEPVTFSTYSNNEGIYSLTVFGDVVPTCSLDGFDFESYADGESLNFSGSFEIEISVTSRNNPVAEALIGTEVTDAEGKATVRVKLGDELLPQAQDMHAEAIVVEDFDDITFELDPLYNLQVEISFEGAPLEGVTVTLDGSELNFSEGVYGISDVWGEGNLVASIDGYRLGLNSDSFERKTDETACSFNIVAMKYYNISGRVKSGGFSVDGYVVASKDGEEVKAEVVDGAYSFENLLGAKTLRFVAEGYTAEEVSVSHLDTVCDFEASYEITGRTVSGNLDIGGVTVTAEGESLSEAVSAVSQNDGSFKLTGLSGAVTLTATLEGYVFDGTIDLSDPYATVVFDSTYSIAGKAFNRVENGENLDGSPNYVPTPLVGVEIYATELDEPLITDSDGMFYLDGIRGRMVLSAYSEDRIDFKPRQLVLTGAGNENTYYFEANAYEVKGKITSGGLPVAGVKLVTDERTAVSGADGAYFFGVLKSLVTITPEKEGYVFSPSSITIENRQDYSDIDFECTYSAAGKVTNGGRPVEGAEVVIDGKTAITASDGSYLFDGLAGSKSITVTKTGYVFSGTFVVSEYKTDLDFESTYSLSGFVYSGGIPVEGVKVSSNGIEILTLADGSFTLSGLSGDSVLAFAKEGYAFRNSSTYNGYATDIEADGTYSISGHVLSGNVAVANVRVTVGAEIVQTSSDGSFRFSGLSGEVEIGFSKDGYTFETKEVSGYVSNINVQCTYNYIVVVIGSKPIEGVIVRGFGQELTTDSSGKAVFEGISGEGTLTFEKAGYTIEPVSVNGYSGADGRQALAKFSVSGVVTTGGIGVSDVTVSCGGKTAVTDSKGQFSFSGLAGTVLLSCTREGYEFVSSGTYSEYTSGIVIEAKYRLEGSVYCEDEFYGGVTVTAYYGDQVVSKMPDSEGKYIFTGLYGETTLTFEREGDYSFNYTTLKVSEYMILEANKCGKLYSVTGTVKVGTYAVSGVTVKAGALTTVTDSNGAFSFDSLVGSTTVVCEIVTTDLDGKTYSIRQQKLVNSTTTVALTFEQKDYVIASIYRAHANLFNRSFRSETSGVAVPSSSLASNQIAGAAKIRGADGSMLLINQNHGSPVFGVEPRIAQQIYFSADGKISFRRVTGDSVQEDKNNTVYGAWEENKTTSELVEFDGVYSPNRLLWYGITSSTVRSISNFAIDNNGKLSFTISLDPVNGITQYILQMKKRSGQEILRFEFVNLTFTINADGTFASLGVNEKYFVTAPVIGEAHATSTTTETFTYENIATVTRP